MCSREINWKSQLYEGVNEIFISIWLHAALEKFTKNNAMNFRIISVSLSGEHFKIIRKTKTSSALVLYL